jgi:hypothetical protein
VKPWSGMSQEKFADDVLDGKRDRQVGIMGPNSLPKPFSEIERHRPDDAPNKLVGFPVRHPGSRDVLQPPTSMASLGSLSPGPARTTLAVSSMRCERRLEEFALSLHPYKTR